MPLNIKKCPFFQFETLLNYNIKSTVIKATSANRKDRLAHLMEEIYKTIPVELFQNF